MKLIERKRTECGDTIFKIRNWGHGEVSFHVFYFKSNGIIRKNAIMWLSSGSITICRDELAKTIRKARNAPK